MNDHDTGTWRQKMVVQQGYGITEAMIAMGVLFLTASGVGYMVLSQKNSIHKVFSSNMCLEYAHSTLGKLTEKGVSRPITFKYLAKDNQSFDVAQTVHEKYIDDTHRWRNVSIVEGDPAANFAFPAVRSSHLILSSINSIGALYNSDNTPSGFCQSPNGRTYSDLAADEALTKDSTMLTAAPRDFRNPTTLLKIRLYDIDTGLDFGGCPSDVILRPRGSAEPTFDLNALTAFNGLTILQTGTRTKRLDLAGNLNNDFDGTQARVASQPANVFSNLGFLVTALVNYDDGQGASRTCSLSQKFQYQRVVPNQFASIRFPGPTLTAFDPPFTTDAYYTENNRDYGGVCGIDAGSATRTFQFDIKIDLSSVPDDLPVQMVCRDISYGIPPQKLAADPPEARTERCMRGYLPYDPMAPGEFTTCLAPRMQYQSKFPTPILPPGSRFEPAGAAVTPINNAYFNNRLWVPCDRVQMCGFLNPTRTETRRLGNFMKIRLTYENAPRTGSEQNSRLLRCFQRYQVAIVDPAGNLRNVQPDFYDVTPPISPNTSRLVRALSGTTVNDANFDRSFWKCNVGGNYFWVCDPAAGGGFRPNPWAAVGAAAAGQCTPVVAPVW